MQIQLYSSYAIFNWDFSIKKKKMVHESEREISKNYQEKKKECKTETKRPKEESDDK